MAEAMQLLKQVYEKETSILGSQLLELAQTDVCWLGGGQHTGEVELGSETCVPQCHRWKPSKQRREEHRKQDKRIDAWSALAGYTIPSLLGGGALASLFKNRDSSSGYKGPCGWGHYRVSWPQEDSMIGPLKKESDTKQVNREGRKQ